MSSNNKDKKPFWGTLPGLLTGCGALITAIGGLIMVLYAAGLLNSCLSSTVTPSPIAESPTLTNTPPPPPTDVPTPTKRPTDTPKPPTDVPTPTERPTDTPKPPTDVPTPTKRPTDTPKPPTDTPTPAIAPEDCLPYSPANLQIIDEGARGWLLTDGVSRMLILDNEADAKDALALARRHTAHCFIGRGNTRPNRKDYIVEYWTENSGLAATIAQRDCIPYNPANLQIIDEGTSGWLLSDGYSRMLILDNERG